MRKLFFIFVFFWIGGDTFACESKPALDSELSILAFLKQAKCYSAAEQLQYLDNQKAFVQMQKKKLTDIEVSALLGKIAIFDSRGQKQVLQMAMQPNFSNETFIFVLGLQPKIRQDLLPWYFYYLSLFAVSAGVDRREIFMEKLISALEKIEKQKLPAFIKGIARMQLTLEELVNIKSTLCRRVPDLFCDAV